MHKKIQRIESYDISEEEYRELYKQPTAPMVVEAVRKYNELVSQSEHVEDKGANAFLIKEAEEADTKAFLDWVFDITQKRD